MSDVTRILLAIEEGDSQAAEQLLPLIYDELRRLATDKMAHEKPGQTLQPTALVHEAYIRTLQPTALVHEAYIRLVDGTTAQHWESRRHFFAAAAEAMRRILIERARQKKAARHGGGYTKVDLDEALAAVDGRADELVALDEALEQLGRHDPAAAELVKLRFFAGLEHGEAAQAMGVGRRQADRLWALARAWLYREMAEK
jgi:RNA polymerase sigma factor (TIGR02999 family)